MNLLKQLWNWFTTPNTDDCCDAEVCQEPTPVEVEEQPSQDIAELFESVCAQIGLGDKFTKGLGATQKFVDWYDGPADEESIRQSLSEFKLTDPAIGAKLTAIGHV